MSSQPNLSLNCTKCQKELNYLPYHSYAEPPAMKSKEGEFYCFDCFKSISHCKVCSKSVAQLDINIHDKNTWYQPWEKVYFGEAEHIRPFDMCGRYCDFLCSPECFAQDENRHHEARMKKKQAELAKGWKNCEECVETYEDIFAKKDKKFCEQAIINRVHLVPPSEKICEFHRRWQEKDRYIKEIIYPKAQKWWDNLTYEQKLAEVKRLGIHWIAAEKRKGTHEEVASQKVVPPFFISQKFEQEEPCISCGKTWKTTREINCGKNSPNGKTSYCASCPSSTENKGSNIKNESKGNHGGSLITEIESKEIQLENAKKEQGENSEAVHELEQEIKELLLKGKDQKSSSNTESLTKNDIIGYSIIGFLLISLIGFVFVLVKAKQKNSKIK